jgi:hypothetical protein
MKLSWHLLAGNNKTTKDPSVQLMASLRVEPDTFRIQAKHVTGAPTFSTLKNFINQSPYLDD